LYNSPSTAGVWKAALDISGRGIVYRAVAWNNTAALHQVGLQIILDGVTVYESYTTGTVSQYAGVIGIGSAYSNQACSFESSCVINMKDDTGGTYILALDVSYALV
jgi:hypothetical protein